MYYNYEGDPCSLEEWAVLFDERQEHGKWRIGATEVQQVNPDFDYDVSTVWIGIDHSFGRGLPLIYETRIFGEGAMDGFQRRYSTRAEALEGHLQTVKELVDYVKQQSTENLLSEDGIKSN